MNGLTVSGLPARFQIERLLGSGAYKAIFLARDELLDRKVAIATVNPVSDIKLDLKEARLMARASEHPNVVSIYDVVETSEQILLVMQYIEGGSLAEKIAGDGDFGHQQFETSLIFARQICQSLKAIHQTGILHRDLKPDNVLITSDNALITDFGIAANTLSGTSGLFYGTPNYVAPEVLLGKPNTVFSDYYALGCTLYELFSGRQAHTGSDMQTIALSTLKSVPQPLSQGSENLPKGLADPISLLLSRDPELRFKGFNQLSDQLSRNNNKSTRIRPKSHSVPSEGSKFEELVSGALDGVPQFIEIIGERGIGKSHNLNELKQVASLNGFRVISNEGISSSATSTKSLLRSQHHSLMAYASSPKKLNHFLDSAETDYSHALFALNEMTRNLPTLICIDDFDKQNDTTKSFILELAELSEPDERATFLVIAISMSLPKSNKPHFLKYPSSITLPLTAIPEPTFAKVVLENTERTFSELELEELYVLSRGNLGVALELESGGFQEKSHASLPSLTDAERELLNHLVLSPVALDTTFLTSLLSLDSTKVWSLLEKLENKGLVQFSENQVQIRTSSIALSLKHDMSHAISVQTHSKIALALQQENGEGPRERYLYHANQSADLIDREILASRAIEASNDAFEKTKFLDAIRYGQIALEHRSHLKATEIAHLFQIIGAAHRSRSELEPARHALMEARQLNENLGNTTGIANALRQLLLIENANIEKSSETLTELDSLLPKLESIDKTEWARCVYTLADVTIGTRDSATQYVSMLKESIDDVKEDYLKGGISMVIASEALDSQSFQESVDFQKLAVKYIESSSRPNEIAEPLVVMTLPLAHTGKFDQLREVSNRINLFDRHECNYRQRLRSLSATVLLEFQTRGPVEALTIAEEMELLLERTKFEQMNGDVLLAVSQLSSLTGDRSRAELALQRLRQPSSTGAPSVFTSICDQFDAILKLHFGDAIGEVPLRVPKTQPTGLISPFRMTRVCANVHLAKSHQKDFVRANLKHLETAAQNKMNWTIGWMFSVPHTIAIAYEKIGQIDKTTAWLDRAHNIHLEQGANWEVKEIERTKERVKLLHQ